MRVSKRFTVAAIEVIALGALSACGGGGGGAAPTASTPTTPIATITDSTPKTSVVTSAAIAAYQPANTLFSTTPSIYPPASEELAAYLKYNEARTTCGFGALTQNAALDKSAANHVEWMRLAGSTGHLETAGSPGFTGVTPADRGVSAGYGAAGSFRAGEALASLKGNPVNTGYGATLTNGLLNAPYHLAGMMVGHRDVGVSIGVRRFQNTVDFATLLFDMGDKNSTGPQTLASDDVKTYPCEGVTGVDIALQNETPNPVPNRDLSVQPIGFSIYVGARAGNQMVVTTAVITNTATGKQEKVASILSAKNDPNGSSAGTYLDSNQTVVFTDSPASSNTKYSAVINGTNNGTPFTRTFSFTTGTGGLN